MPRIIMVLAAIMIVCGSIVPLQALEKENTEGPEGGGVPGRPTTTAPTKPATTAPNAPATKTIDVPATTTTKTLPLSTTVPLTVTTIPSGTTNTTTTTTAPPQCGLPFTPPPPGTNNGGQCVLRCVPNAIVNCTNLCTFEQCAGVAKCVQFYGASEATNADAGHCFSNAGCSNAEECPSASYFDE